MVGQRVAAFVGILLVLTAGLLALAPIHEHGIGSCGNSLSAVAMHDQPTNGQSPNPLAPETYTVAAHNAAAAYCRSRGATQLILATGVGLSGIACALAGWVIFRVRRPPPELTPGYNLRTPGHDTRHGSSGRRPRP